VSVDIRPATEDEFVSVLEFWRVATAVPSSTDDLPGLSVLHQRDSAALMVAVDRERVIGTVITTWDGWRGGFARLAVHPQRRGEGIARSLIRAGETHLAALGCRRITLFAVADHQPAVAFWTAVGYTPHPEDIRFVTNLAPRHDA
jgi:ribosomal protein S18 acetylase RimI-like enzyme